MPIGEICNREVIVVNRDDSVLEAARLMRSYHVGDVIVVDRENDQNIPVGVLTDRDITIEIVAKEIDAKEVNVADVMSRDIIVAREDDELTVLIRQMQVNGVRRVPVINNSGTLVGIVSESDLLELIREQLSGLISIVKKGEQREESLRL